MVTKSKSGTSEAQYLTAKQASEFTGLRISYLYKLTCKKRIPHYNPSGRKLLFKKSELEAWIESARVSTDLELEKRVANQMMMEK